MSAESPQICAGRVVIITGAGRGIGRAHALEFARQGAKVVVNDLGVAPDGSDPTETPAQQVVDEIRTLGGEAVASAHDVSGWDSAKEMIDLAIDHFGGLDVVVNNAGIGDGDTVDMRYNYLDLNPWSIDFFNIQFLKSRGCTVFYNPQN